MYEAAKKYNISGQVYLRGVQGREQKYNQWSGVQDTMKAHKRQIRSGSLRHNYEHGTNDIRADQFEDIRAAQLGSGTHPGFPAPDDDGHDPVNLPVGQFVSIRPDQLESSEISQHGGKQKHLA